MTFNIEKLKAMSFAELREDRDLREVLENHQELPEDIRAQIPDELFDRIQFVRGYFQEIADSEKFILPKADLSVFCSKDINLAEEKFRATFFVFLKGRQQDDPFSSGSFTITEDSEIVVYVTSHMDCPYGTCGLSSVLQEFTHMYHAQGFYLYEKGIGILRRSSPGTLEISWGSFGGASQTPNLEDLDYHGPYPSKFANWVRDQILDELERRGR